MPSRTSNAVGRRVFLTSLSAAAVGTACRSRTLRKPLILRLSHSMVAATNSLHLFAETFRRAVDTATHGEVSVRIFASGTLGQEREIVQQVQEGLVDFMVSGSAIWGSVAPRLQVLDFPFLWKDWDHVHRVLDGALGSDIANYLEATARIRPFAWGDSFGFRHVVTRSRAVTDPSQFAGLKIRTIQSAIYVKAIELMGASPTPMAFGEVYTSLQTGVIDGYEHDASTTLLQRFYEVAHAMTRTAHIAGVIGLWASTVTLARLPVDVRGVLEQAAREAAAVQRASGPAEEAAARQVLATRGMTFAEFDSRPFLPKAEQLWSREAQALGVAAWLETIRA